ncbi:hypothetical protein M427DRAFT_337640 [Gonapodya prolifera JEL478]|uniref:Uncharacterized protein n=1 Tax=Gonapodya prolifera (strain JEL478) TaxID=1344416 RepID=A0A139AD94_GONPJ|nr:hypothetical protein M427DRAFT_337640 [Gonapodya prolifera JEL478]|eukprot:KXS14740.1 hypothetical protein M427DRAFT_337640 [Gonapodya prolifera JEL478]
MASEKSSLPWNPEVPIKINAHATSANSLAFGLFGFATQVTLIGLLSAGLIEGSGAAIVFTFFVVTGVLQLIVAGIQLTGRGDLLGNTAMMTFGAYVTSLGVFNLLAMSGTINPGGPTKDAMTAIFSLYTYVTFVFLIAALKINVATVINFAGVMLLFALSAAGSHTGSAAINTASGWVGIFTGISGYYAATGLFLGEWFQYPVLPAGDLSGFWIRRAERARAGRVQSEATILVARESV